MENFSLDDSYSSELNETSTSPALPIGHTLHLFIPVLNIFLSITAALGNALILVALHKETSLHPPTKLLFRCLAVTDLCVGLITQPLYAITTFMPQATKMNWVVLNYFITANYISSYTLCGVSGLTSAAISVDRLLALLLGLRYKQVVTLWRVRKVLILFWSICVSCGLMYIWSESATLIVVFVFVVLCLVTSIFSYTKIFLKLREHQVQVRDHVHQGQTSGEGETLNIVRYKKTVSSISWIQLTLIMCYVPYGIESLLWISGIDTDYSWLSTATLVYLNSSLNPILYCWKIREVRQAVKDTIRQLCCRANSVALHVHADEQRQQ